MKYYSTQLLQEVQQHIQNGGVIAYPTESCYGFGCDPFNPIAIQKIINLKRRNKNKGMIVIAGSIKQLDKLIQPLNNEEIESIFNNYWPGSYSLILPVTKKVPHILVGQHKQIAVRITKHELVKQLCNYLNMPLVSTSANKSGNKSIKTYKECVRHFGNDVLVLPGNTLFAKKPSTIIDYKNKKIYRA